MLHRPPHAGLGRGQIGLAAAGGGGAAGCLTAWCAGPVKRGFACRVHGSVDQMGGGSVGFELDRGNDGLLCFGSWRTRSGYSFAFL